MDTFVINKKDNVGVNLGNGHKYALTDIKCGSDIIKYGFPIGSAVADIAAGELVHSHNMKTKLSGISEYSYTHEENPLTSVPPFYIDAYERSDGNIGIRNDIWIINTVGCVNKTAETLARLTGSFSFPHPYGCSQLSGDYTTTQKILCGLIKHPNAGGVLVLGLGCENNNIPALKKVLGEYDPARVKFLNVQDSADEIEDGVRIIDELRENASNDIKSRVPVSRLKIGLKCGGSDGLSGITANPLAGIICDRFASMGAACVLTEVPEMFGAEQILMNRCVNEEVFNKTVALINSFKGYFASHNEPVSENPSPGNKEGGITTLEEKSLGCVQKGGMAPVTDVLDYGDTVNKAGLNLLNGPGNDMVAVTNLTAAGCQIILFTTGRGTPLGAPVPTVKISTNTALAEKKPHWIDFDAGRLLSDSTVPDEFMNFITDVLNGRETENEKHGYREIAIFKDGVTL